MKNCNTAATPIVTGLEITDKLITDNGSSSFIIKEYMFIVESLLFLVTYTRPNIIFAAGFLVCWNKAPTL